MIIAWVKDYLTNRSQYVVVNGASSQPSAVVSGVPQGSVLGPLLFIIYINDLLEQELTAGSAMHVYADDILLYRTIISTHNFLSLQSDIDKVTAWSSANFLTLNRKKCKFMVSSRRQSPSYPDIPLMIEDHPLERVLSFKYLGVLLSCDLSWSMHIQTITSRAKKVLGLLYRRFYNLSPPDVLLHLYLSLVRPHLEYASVVWSPYLKKDIFHLENVQKFGLRMATKMWTYPYHYLLYRSHLNSLESRRSIARLCTLFKLLHQLDYAECTVSLRSKYIAIKLGLHLTLCQPFCQSNFSYHSFLPFTISLWNKLDLSIVSSSLKSFKHSLMKLYA